MKNIIFIITIALISLSCKAQIYSLQSYEDATNWPLPNGAYAKDIYNDFNIYEGIWKFEDTNNTLIIEFKKRTMFYDVNNSIYLDLLIGEYKFIENGVEKVNTLNNINNNSSVNSNSLRGNLFNSPANFPICNDCLPNERRVELTFSDPDRPWVKAYIVLRHKVISGVEYIDAIIYYTQTVVPDDGTPSTLRLPAGNYLLVKQ